MGPRRSHATETERKLHKRGLDRIRSKCSLFIGVDNYARWVELREALGLRQADNPGVASILLDSYEELQRLKTATPSVMPGIRAIQAPSGSGIASTMETAPLFGAAAVADRHSQPDSLSPDEMAHYEKLRLALCPYVPEIAQHPDQELSNIKQQKGRSTLTASDSDSEGLSGVRPSTSTCQTGGLMYSSANQPTLLDMDENIACVPHRTASTLAPDPGRQSSDSEDREWAEETVTVPNGQDVHEGDDRRYPPPTRKSNLDTTALHSEPLHETATMLTEADIKQEPEEENFVSSPEHCEETGDSENDRESNNGESGVEDRKWNRRKRGIDWDDFDWEPSYDSNDFDSDDYEPKRKTIKRKIQGSKTDDQTDLLVPPKPAKTPKRAKKEAKKIVTDTDMNKDLHTHDPFQCLKCDQEYEIHMELCTHIMKEHTTEDSPQVDVCVLCTKPWTPALLGKHMREVHGVEDFVDWSADNNLHCSECTNIHQDVLSFLFHLEDAHRTTAVKCSKCEFTSIYSYQLFRHMAKKHGCMDQENVIVTDDRPVYIYKKRSGKTTCDICGVYPGKYLMKHIQTEHSEAVNVHRYPCYICKKIFPRYQRLQLHCNTYHRGCPCLFCPTSRSSRKEIVEHISGKHLNITKYTCNLCHPLLHFKGHYLYGKHIKVVHEGKKNFLCEECGKSFKTSSSLHIHYRQHTGEKPIMCTECGFRCRQPNSLNWHKKKHHPK